MMKTIILPIFIMIFALSSCSQDNPIIPAPSPTGTIEDTPVISSPTPSSGIEGRVTEGPMCPGPVPVGNNPCPDQPYQATISILDANNTKIIQIQTDVNGYFKVTLAPGTYILHPEAGKPFPYASDQSVVVIDGQYIQVTILYDTGMR